ncbi:DUF1272 domain-containing protein [Simiduia agarivorans]|uniref:Urease-associated protein n=1 Tax=Simiduia agarivorans (strain DSM 21679 / JCM 13881 / BCRC 17597 / SA1) TaxID=1117647 RepID=K4KN13_SIMAS|nr:DUF1272 domain-containing protein [Simiduia agarivorans]AFU99493.1 hypothetical protein M5M_11580 [Simiduia agarivorans SA1 = DSM 21679]
MLVLKPNCECCDCDLPPDSGVAMICSYECTFCKHCVDNVLENVCPNCGGGFTLRPVRPANAYRPGVSLKYQPASEVRVNTGYSRETLSDFAQAIKAIAPDKR